MSTRPAARRAAAAEQASWPPQSSSKGSERAHTLFQAYGLCVTLSCVSVASVNLPRSGHVHASGAAADRAHRMAGCCTQECSNHPKGAHWKLKGPCSNMNPSKEEQPCGGGRGARVQCVCCAYVGWPHCLANARRQLLGACVAAFRRRDSPQTCPPPRRAPGRH